MSKAPEPHQSVKTQEKVEPPWKLAAEQAKTNSLPSGKVSKRETKITSREAEPVQHGAPQDGYYGGTVPGEKK